MRFSVSCAVVVLVISPPALSAQVLPGGTNGRAGSGATQMRLAHVAFVRPLVDAVLAGLANALNARDAQTSASFYAKDATVITPTGAFVHGREAVRQRYAAALARMEGVELRITMFDASGDFAHVLGTLRYAARLSSGAVVPMEEPVTLLLRSVNGEWLIQTHSGGHLPSLVRAQSPVPNEARVGDSVRVAVQVIDPSGDVLRNVVVSFVRDAGAATIDRCTVMTDATGVASTMLRLGEEPGVVIVRAAPVGVAGDPVVFRITAQPPLAEGEGRAP